MKTFDGWRRRSTARWHCHLDVTERKNVPTKPGSRLFFQTWDTTTADLRLLLSVAADQPPRPDDAHDDDAPAPPTTQQHQSRTRTQQRTSALLTNTLDGFGLLVLGGDFAQHCNDNTEREIQCGKPRPDPEQRVGVVVVCEHVNLDEREFRRWAR